MADDAAPLQPVDPVPPAPEPVAVPEPSPQPTAEPVAEPAPAPEPAPAMPAPPPVPEPAQPSPPPAPEPKPEPVSAPSTPHDRLKAFEDEKFGKDCVRINGEIERGHGSLFERLSDEDKAHYAALERLIVAHDKLEAAQAALHAAEHEAADAEIAADAAG